MYTIKVRLNGTDENIWHKWGLKKNPFPQIGKAEFDAAERQINSLDGDPIKNIADIRRRLEGFDREFIELCIKQFKPGKRTVFEVTFPED
jgi:hypothetical protein